LNTVLTFGEALLKLTLPPATRLEEMHTAELQCAGSELNVAAGLASLGHSASWVSALPPGPLGDWARRHIRALGVRDLSLERPGRLGTFYLEDHHAPRSSRVVYDRAGSAFAGLTGADFEPGWLSEVRAMHLSGISLALGAGPRALAMRLLAEAKTQGLYLSFDLNHRRLLLGEAEAAAVYGPAALLADLIFVAERDTHLLGGIGGLRALNPRAWIVQTQGAAGSLLLLPGGQHLHQPALSAQGPGRIGRGDAYAAGFLSAVLRGESPECSLQWATACAALKTSLPGDQLRVRPGEVDEVLRALPGGEPIR
jgi:2-dehydro-3-deoxygluconokinase